LLAERIRCLLNYCRLPNRGEFQFMRRNYAPGMPGSREEDLRVIATTKVLFTSRILIILVFGLFGQIVRWGWQSRIAVEFHR
jgi:hypothetical protein